MYIAAVPYLAQAQAARPAKPTDEETVLAKREGTAVLSKDTVIDGLPVKAGMKVEFQDGELVLRNINADLALGVFVIKKGSSLYLDRKATLVKENFVNGVSTGQKILRGAVKIELAADLKIDEYLFLKGSAVALTFNGALRFDLMRDFHAIYHGLKINSLNPMHFHPNGTPVIVFADQGNTIYGIRILENTVLQLRADRTVFHITSPRPQAAKIGLFEYELNRGVTFHKNNRVQTGTLAKAQLVDGKPQESGTTIELDERGKLKDAWRQR